MQVDAAELAVFEVDRLPAMPDEVVALLPAGQIGLPAGPLEQSSSPGEVAFGQQEIDVAERAQPTVWVVRRDARALGHREPDAVLGEDACGLLGLANERFDAQFAHRLVGGQELAHVGRDGHVVGVQVIEQQRAQPGPDHVVELVLVQFRQLDGAPIGGEQHGGRPRPQRWQQRDEGRARPLLRVRHARPPSPCRHRQRTPRAGRRRHAVQR